MAGAAQAAVARLPVSSALLLDTNVFDAVLDGTVPATAFDGFRLLVTGVQAAELRAVPDRWQKRREALIQAFEEVAPETSLAESFCFDVDGAGWDQARYNDGSGDFERMLARLKVLDHDKAKSQAQHLNQIRDIVTAEVAIKLGVTLVTSDAKLITVVREFGGAAERPETFGLNSSAEAAT